MSIRQQHRHTRLGERHLYAKMWFDHSWPALAVAAIGFVLSLIAASAIGRWESSSAKVEFEAGAKNQAIILQNGVNEYLTRLMTLRTLFESANDEITRHEFEAFSRRLFEDRHGILNIHWVPKVRGNERIQYEKLAIADGISGYRFQSAAPDGARTSAPVSNVYYPVFYSTQPKTSAFYGTDFGSHVERRATLERARDDDSIAALPSTALFTKLGKRGTLVAVPVYVKGTSRDSIADRRRNLVGFIVGIFELPRLLEAILSTTPVSSGVNLDIYAPGTEIDVTSVRHPLFRLSSTSLKEEPITEPPAEPHWSSALKVGDATWQTISTLAASGRLTTSYSRALIVFVAGLVITAIAVTYIFSTRRHSRQLELANHQVSDLARTDVLTKLFNRRAFFDGLGEAFGNARRDGDTFSVLYFDLDHFKDVNDTLGHAFGDELLRQVADRLRATARRTDLVARFGGDEFAVIEREIFETEPADALAEKIRVALAAPYEINGAVVHVSASIGIACYAPDLVSADALIVQADLALYRAKEDGRNCCRCYSPQLSQQVDEHVTVADELRGAVARGELSLAQQSRYLVLHPQRRSQPLMR